MTKVFLDQLTHMIDQATSGQIGDVLSCKHFFSGAAVYANGRICGSLTAVGFASKLRKESSDSLLKHRGARPLKVVRQRPVKKEYVALPTALMVAPSSLRGSGRIRVSP